MCRITPGATSSPPFSTWGDRRPGPQREAVLARVASVAPEMVDDFPLLNDVLPLGIPEPT
jgi:hypothetical protein